jgi:hypothetical protein
MTDIGRSRRAWRRSFFILLGVSVVLVGGLLIAVADKKVSYAEQPVEVREDLDVIARLLPAQQPAPSRSDVLRMLRRQNPKARILATDSTVSIGQLVFHFGRAGRLDRVEHPEIRRD